MHFSILILAIAITDAFAACNLGSGKRVKFTNYWVAIEGTKDEGDDGQEITLSGPNTVTLKTCDGQTIAQTNEKFSKKCSLEGTCRLADGRTLNVGDTMHCFQVLPASQKWGLGNRENALVPMVSVACNGLKYGTKLKIKELEGRILPNGKKHNGCVRIDDTCSTCEDACHLDFLVGTYQYYKQMNLPEKVTAKVDSGCQILNYGM